MRLPRGLRVPVICHFRQHFGISFQEWSVTSAGILLLSLGPRRPPGVLQRGLCEGGLPGGQPGGGQLRLHRARGGEGRPLLKVGGGQVRPPSSGKVITEILGSGD